MMTSHASLRCDETRQSFLRVIEDFVHCSRVGNALILDTPYSFGGGNLLRVYLFESTRGIKVSDGGYAARQIEMLSPVQTNWQSYNSLRSLARAHGLQWDGQLYYESESLEDALYGIGRLAQALHEAEIALARPRQSRLQTRDILKKGFAARSDLQIEWDKGIVVPDLRDAIVVDALAKTRHGQAALEIIEAQTDTGVLDQVNRSITNFAALQRGGYTGHLVGIYNREILRDDNGALERFKAAKDPRVLLMDEVEAVEEVGHLLDAA